MTEVNKIRKIPLPQTETLKLTTINGSSAKCEYATANLGYYTRESFKTYDKAHILPMFRFRRTDDGNTWALGIINSQVRSIEDDYQFVRVGQYQEIVQHAAEFFDDMPMELRLVEGFAPVDYDYAQPVSYAAALTLQYAGKQRKTTEKPQKNESTSTRTNAPPDVSVQEKPQEEAQTPNIGDFTFDQLKTILDKLLIALNKEAFAKNIKGTSDEIKAQLLRAYFKVGKGFNIQTSTNKIRGAEICKFILGNISFNAFVTCHNLDVVQNANNSIRCTFRA